MASVIGWVWFGIGILGVIDAFRHSASDWAFADRNRTFWVLFMLCFGPPFVAAYTIMVRRRFPNHADAASTAFMKD